MLILILLRAPRIHKVGILKGDNLQRRNTVILFAMTFCLVLMNVFTVFATDYSYSTSTQTVSLTSGTYTIEAWGRQGNPGANGYYFNGGPGGTGGHAKGTLTLVNPATLYIVGSDVTNIVRLDINDVAHNLLYATSGGTGGDCYDDYDFGYDGEQGIDGTGWVSGILTHTSTDAASGGPLVRITPVAATISTSTPEISTTYSAQEGYEIITITGKVAAFEGGSVTVSATINGKSKSAVVNPVSTSWPDSDNYTLTWDVVADDIAEGSYSDIVVSTNVSSVSTTWRGTIKIDRSPPTLNTLISENIQSNYIAVVMNGFTNDVAGSNPVQYQFNLNGADVGIWQADSTYTFSNLIASTSYAIKYKVKDSVGNISNYSAILSISTIASTDYNYYAGGPIIVTLDVGTYTFEVWGRQGNPGANGYYFNGGSGGTGGHAKGTLTLVNPATLYIVSSGSTNIVRLDINDVAHNLLYATSGGTGGDCYDDYDFGYDGEQGIDGTGWVSGILTHTSTDAASGGPLVRITIPPAPVVQPVSAPASPSILLISAPTVRDVSNNNDGSDIQVSFVAVSNEIGVSQYRIFVVPTSQAGLFFTSTALGLSSSRYMDENISGNNETHTVTLAKSLFDSMGKNIINGRRYKVFVLSIGQNGFSNTLSSGSSDFILTSSSVLTLQSNFATGVFTNSGVAVGGEVKLGTISEDFEDSNYAFTFAGAWISSSITPYEGVYVYKNVAITHNQTANMQTTVTVGTGSNVTFRYRISSEANCDKMLFYIDNKEMTGGKSGTIGWTQAIYSLTAGTHILKWSYTKDGSVSSGEDSVYIDNLVVSDGPVFSSSGTYISPILDLSSAGTKINSSISWLSIVPANADVVIETNLSTNGGKSWLGWQVATNEGRIPGVTSGTNLSNGKLQYRATLSTKNYAPMAQLFDVIINIEKGVAVVDKTGFATPIIPKVFSYVVEVWNNGHVIKDDSGNQWVETLVGGLAGGFIRRDLSAIRGVTVTQTSDTIPSIVTLNSPIARVSSFYNKDVVFSATGTNIS